MTDSRRTLFLVLTVDLRRLSGEVTLAEKASAVAQKDLNQVESKLTLLRQQKKAAEEEANDNEAAVEEQTEGQDLDKAIAEAEEEIHDRETYVLYHEHTERAQLTIKHSNIEQLNSAVGFYQRVIDHGQKEHVCIACSRGLSDADLPKFKAYVSAQSFKSRTRNHPRVTNRSETNYSARSRSKTTLRKWLIWKTTFLVGDPSLVAYERSSRWPPGLRS